MGNFNFKTLSEIQVENGKEKNRVDINGYGPEYASNAVRMTLISPKPTGKHQRLLVAEHASGTALPTIRLRIVDAFGHTVSSGISDSGTFVPFQLLLKTNEQK